MKRTFALMGMLLLMTAPALAVGGLELNEVDIHGFISQGYVTSSDYDYFRAETEAGTYEFNEFGLNISSRVTDDLRLGMQLLSRDLGDLGNNTVEIDWAYADYSYRNWLGLRAGKIKKADGIFNQYRDIDATRTCIFLPQALYREDTRDTALAYSGVGIYGALPGGLEYQANCGVMDIDEDGGIARVLEDDAGAEIADIDVDPAYSAWVNWQAPLSGLSIGASLTDFNFNMDGDAVNSFPLSSFTGDPTHAATFLETKTPMAFKIYGEEYRIFSQYRYEDLMLAAEYLWGEHNVDTSVAGMTIKQEMEPQAWYVMATYRFCNWFELGTYYCEDLEDKNDRNGDGHKAEGKPRAKAWLNDWAVSARFDLNPFWAFKLEAHFMDGLKDVDFGDDPDPDNRWEMYAAKLTYVF